MIDSDNRDIRGVLITVTDGRLLLPNASVAEVISYSEPEQVENAPGWLPGRVRWRGWRLPVVSFARLAGLAESEREFGAKVAVIKLLGGNSKLPYFALLTQGFPRLVTVSRDALLAAEDGNLPLGVARKVMLNEDVALIPDLATLEMLLKDALASAA